MDHMLVCPVLLVKPVLQTVSVSHIKELVVSAIYSVNVPHFV